MKSKYKMLAGLGVAVAGAALMAADPAAAQGLVTMQTNTTAQGNAGLTILGVILQLAGVGTMAASAAKFKENAVDDQRTPIKIPLMLAGAGALLMGVPEYASMGIGTVFGNGAKTSGNAGTLQSITPK